MYSTYNSVLEKNQMFTPPTIGLTSSIVNDKLNSISLNDNSSELFTVNETADAIQTKDNIPLEASQFIITGSNEEIDKNENNAVNKRYLSTKINSLEDKYFLKSNIINKDQDPSNETVYSSLSTHTLLGEKANTEDVYDKSKIDYKLSLKANIEYVNQKVGIKADTIEVNKKLNLKANIDDVYNKTDIDNKLSTINQNIDLKANTADVYDKTECDNRYMLIGSISKNIEVYPKLNLLNLLDPLTSTVTNISPYIYQKLFTVNIPAESNVSLTDSGMTLWHLKFVLYISSTGSDAEQLKDLMGIRLSAYIDEVYHEFSLSIHYLTSYARLYMDSTFITNSLPTEDKSLRIYVTSPTSIPNLQIEFRNYSNVHNYIYRIGLTA